MGFIAGTDFRVTNSADAERSQAVLYYEPAASSFAIRNSFIPIRLRPYQRVTSVPMGSSSAPP